MVCSVLRYWSLTLLPPPQSSTGEKSNYFLLKYRRQCNDCSANSSDYANKSSSTSASNVTNRTLITCRAEIITATGLCCQHLSLYEDSTSFAVFAHPCDGPESYGWAQELDLECGLFCQKDKKKLQATWSLTVKLWNIIPDSCCDISPAMNQIDVLREA